MGERNGEDGSDIGTRISRVPSIIPEIDLSRFSLDPVTEKLIAGVDGRSDIEKLARSTGVDLQTALQRFEQLGEASIVELEFGRDRNSGRRPGEVDRSRASLPVKSAERVEGGWVGEITGELGETTARDLLERAAREKLSGVLRFAGDGGRIETHFEDGRPLAATSTFPRHEHGEMLRAAGKISEQTHRAYREALAAGAEHAPAALFRAGVKDRKQLARLLTWRGSAILKEVSEWSSGSYALVPGAPFPPKVARCSLILPARKKRGVERGWRKAVIEKEDLQHLEANRARYLVPAESAAGIAARLGLKDKEKRLVDHLLEEPTQLARAEVISTLFRRQTRMLLLELIRRGAFELSDTNPKGDRPHELEDLGGLARRIERANHFDVLTAHPVSTPAEIEQRYRKRLDEFDPRAYPGAEPEHLEHLAAIRRRLDRAWEVLSDKSTRRACRRQLYDREQLINFTTLQLRKAQTAIRMRNDPLLGCELAASVLDIDSDNIDARLLLVEALIGMGRYADAERHLPGSASVPSRLRGDHDRLRRRLAGGG
ncbi:MAG: DUF4388 domain-containing protein [Polyangia bacterium]